MQKIESPEELRRLFITIAKVNGKTFRKYSGTTGPLDKLSIDELIVGMKKIPDREIVQSVAFGPTSACCFTAIEWDNLGGVTYPIYALVGDMSTVTPSTLW